MIKKTFLYIVFIMGMNTAKAQYTVLHNFNDTLGGFPTGSLTLAGNKLYGMTWMGGAYGAGIIFCINPDGSGYTDMLDFNGTNGSYPFGSLIADGNVLYGM